MQSSTLSGKLKNVFVYFLRCPDTSVIKYVGKSCNPRARLSAHMSIPSRGNPEKQIWIDSLKRDGKRPVLDIPIGPVDSDAANECELRLIFLIDQADPNQLVNKMVIPWPTRSKREERLGRQNDRLRARIAVLESENAQLRAQSPAPLLNATA